MPCVVNIDCTALHLMVLQCLMYYVEHISTRVANGEILPVCVSLVVVLLKSSVTTTALTLLTTASPQGIIQSVKAL